MFADHLGKQGIAVLIPDKRGSGQSEGEWREVGLEELAEDAVAAIRYLKEQDRWLVSKIGIAGFSQGGHIAPVAAARSQDIDFVVNVSGGAVTMEETMIHEVTQTAIKEGLRPHQISQMLDLHAAMLDYATERDWSRLQPEIAKALASDWADFAHTLPLEKDLWLWDWVKKVAPFDPVPHWQHVRVPVLVAYGALDAGDKVMVWPSVYRLHKAFRGNQDYEIRIYPETGHALFEPEAQYLHREFGEYLVEWIRTRTGVAPVEVKETKGWVCPPCPLFPHNDEIYHKKGTCPRCGMPLVPKIW